MNSLSLLGLFLILCITFPNASPQSTEAYEYDRIDEVKRECSSILPPDFDHKSYGNQLYRLPDKLSFVNGDWWQDLDKAPLLPYDDKLPDKFMGKSSPLNLTSFWITDVDDAHRSKNSVSVNGVLELRITMDEFFSSKPYERNPIFKIYPGISRLRMSFQGIVTYSEENNGEIVMCLLGNAVLPSRSPDSNSPWDWVKETNYINQPKPISDERIMLVIHYPEKFTMKKRGIHGSLKSLNPKSSQKYFDNVYISASLSSSATYEFSPQNLVSNSFSKANKDLGSVKGTNFCHILNRFLGQDSLTVVPNWRCNGTHEFCSKLGPFETGASIKATNGSFKCVALHFQDVRCEKPSSDQGKDGGVEKVAMVIRVSSPSDYHYAVAQRSGLNNMTLSAEGVWDPSTGHLCMVGCLGESCGSRICLHFPLSFSIKQRSMILGSILSFEDSNMSFFPLAFTKRVHYSTLSRNQYYEYSKIDLARALLEKHECLFNLETMIKKSFLTFPKLNDPESFPNRLSYLAEELTLYHQVVSESSSSGLSPSQTNLQIRVLSLGSLLGHRWSHQKDRVVEEDTRYADNSQLMLNVSGQISLTGSEYGNFSDLSVEGLYHPRVGKMYLVGCRDVRDYLNLLSESLDLEDGFDCLIEVVVSYPPTATRNWLGNSIARVSIASQRNELDPLFFKPIKLQTAISSTSSRGVEGMLQVVTPLMAIGCILSQLFYIKENLDSIHYVSLAMLGVQALGYGFPLVTGVESNDNSSAYTKNQMIQVIDYRIKILVLISFLLTLRLYQKVWRSRIRLLSRRAVLRPHPMPSDRPVLLVTFFIHVFGFGCFLIVHKLQSKLVKIEEYLGLVQDFFLLPQVIGNLIWQIDCKPLRKSYFVGLTVIRLLPHVYSYRSSGIAYPSSDDLPIYNPAKDIAPSYLTVYPEEGSSIGIPTIAIFLAIAVYVQQKWSYEDLGRRLTFGKFRLLPRWSRADERLLPVEAEAELNAGFNGLLKTLQRRRGWK